MMETIFQLGISNAAIVSLLAIVAFGVGACTNRAKLTHLLWVLVSVCGLKAATKLQVKSGQFWVSCCG